MALGVNRAVNTKGSKQSREQKGKQTEPWTQREADLLLVDRRASVSAFKRGEIMASTEFEMGHHLHGGKGMGRGENGAAAFFFGSVAAAWHGLWPQLPSLGLFMDSHRTENHGHSGVEWAKNNKSARLCLPVGRNSMCYEYSILLKKRKEKKKTHS